ncbi:hypothetical protein H8K90_01830 [Winogradskyella echinorum]|uniref:CarboxypepD_reg-like domain-containing protein n=1 Tax=Winogradskyella echinorum TaxID=538189 RepID=A0ABR6XX97_9FLAO|nr:hypothetical protein [Winogradskyella echinorum]MBC3845106.1 hypothetical protein [Winogradskyella echinorum]MBC5749454.1 hypothetical protein [Winogradskyella echinorum]
MKKINAISLLIAVAMTFVVNAQRKDLKGQVIADDEVEGLHIQNRTAAKYTISNEDGSFVIPAKATDTLIISGVKYQTQELVITQSNFDLGNFSVVLIENLNELDEVRVGKILTGSLESDLENSDAKTEINFYDLGIPGYKGKPLTQNERKLHDADAGPMGYIGLGAGVNLHKLLNKISGRTKKLKAIVALDNEEKCISRLRREYEKTIFRTDTLAENLKNEYFYFCQEDEGFKALCEENNDLKAIEFLQRKLKAYNKNRESVTKD